MNFLRSTLALPALLSMLTLSASGQDRVMVFGDSQSEEYAFEIPFSAPFAGDISDHADNWIEILDQRRDEQLDFGDYEPTLFGYGDYRNAGHEYNWSVPGARSETLREIVTGDGLQFLTSALKIRDQLEEDNIKWVVIFLGGNDIDRVYTDLYDDEPPADFPSAILGNLETLIDQVYARHPAARIVLVNVPDIGVTPKQSSEHPDPGKRLIATAHIAELNRRIGLLASGKGAELADVAGTTTRIGAPDPFYLGWLEMVKAGSTLNPADHLFCRDGFHPNSGAQALIANEILTAMNRWPDTDIPLLSNREIIDKVLKIDPDRPYLNWLAAEGLPNSAPFSGDANANGKPDLVDFVAPAGNFDLRELAPGQKGWSISLNAEARGFATLNLEKSATLQSGSWLPVAKSEMGNLSYVISEDDDESFYRFTVDLIP